MLPAQLSSTMPFSTQRRAQHLFLSKTPNNIAINKHRINTEMKRMVQVMMYNFVLQTTT